MSGDDTEVARVYRKVALHVMPLLFLCFLLAYLDRVNVSFAKEHMSSALGLSSFAYGLGAGIFFIGYFIFEVPSNLWMERIGARRTLLRIMTLWGLTSASMALVTDELTFYILRFFLGAFEAGFAPGVLLYLSRWTPSVMRARFMGLFLTATAVAGLIGAPLSGWIISTFDGSAGIAGWQWMFVLQGLPSVAMGVVVFLLLPDSPGEARWLNDDERRVIEHTLATDPKGAGAGVTSFRAALRNSRVYLLSLAYFCLSGGVFLITFWLPTALSEFDVSNSTVLGWIIAIPYLCAVVGLLVVGRLSDRSDNRRLFCAVPMAVGAAALTGTMFTSGSLPVTVVLFSVAAFSIWSVYGVFWSIPATLYSGLATAGSIALINSVGNINGFVNPFVVGALESLTGSLYAGMSITIVCLLIGAVLILVTVEKKEHRTT